MYFMLNEMNFSEIFDKFDRIHNDTIVIKIRIINKMNFSLI